MAGELEHAAAQLGERVRLGRPVAERELERRVADLLQQLGVDLDQAAVLGRPEQRRGQPVGPGEPAGAVDRLN